MSNALALDYSENISNAIPIYGVIINTAEEGGYWAKCPQLPGCFTQGETLRETQTNMYEAIDLYLEDTPYDANYVLSFEVKRA